MSDRFDFACPSCAAPGKARAEWSGRSVRCTHCKAVFVLPSPGEAAADSYDLAEPVEDARTAIPPAPSAEEGGSTFTPTYHDAPLPDVPRDRQRRRAPRELGPLEQIRRWGGDLRVRVLVGLLIGVSGAAALAFLVPDLARPGGWVLVVGGVVMTAFGFLVGAYAAFCEDALHGMLYLVFPIYTGYYLVTRFDDLWPFFAVQTIGFVCFLLGSRALAVGGAF